jgi:pentatricopeptide repeat protein
MLKQRAKAANAAAIAGLRRLLTRPCGPDAVRLELLDWLAEQGLQPRGQPVELLAGGRVRITRSYGLHIHDRPRPSTFPPQGQALEPRIHKALHRGALREAMELAQQLRDKYPDQPAALNDLAVIRQAMGAPFDEVAALYRQAWSLAPDYLFARCGLARCLAELGQVDEARALLEGMLERSDWHHSEYRSLLLAQRALAQASHDDEATDVIDQGLQELRQRFAG